MTRSRLRGCGAGAVLLLAACSTSYSWEASVALQEPLSASCVDAALRSRDDVFDIVETGPGAYALRLEIPGVERKKSPSLAVTQGPSADDLPALEVSTGYRTGWLQKDQTNQVLLERAGELTSQLVEDCASRPVELGITHPCGRGEIRSLCVSGSVR